MRLGVVSDTHAHIQFTREAVNLLAAYEVDTVLHCGDIGSPNVVAQFDAWPTHFVFGNVDRDVESLRAAIEAAGQTCHGRFGALEFEGRQVALIHGDDRQRLLETVNLGEWDLVCCGHTHVFEQQQIGPTRVLNPGALFRATPHTLAIVEFPSLEVTRVTV